MNKVFIASNLAGKGGQALPQDTANLGLHRKKTYPGAISGQAASAGSGRDQPYFIDNFSYVAGRHQLKLADSSPGPSSSWTSTRLSTGAGILDRSRVRHNDPTSYPLYTLTLGIATDIESHWNAAAYVQDTWKAREDLTLNLGVRWDADTSVTNGNQFVDGYNQRIVATYGGAPPIQKIKASLHDISPRLGLVWVPAADRRTTVRLSGGSFYDQNHYNYSDILLNQTLLNQAIRLQRQRQQPQPVLQSCGRERQPGSAAGVLTRFPESPNLRGRQSPQVANGLDPHFRSPYTVQVTGGATPVRFEHLRRPLRLVRGQIIQRQTNLQLVNGVCHHRSAHSQFSCIRTSGGPI